MKRHLLAKFVAVLLFLAALVVFLAGIVAAVAITRGGLGVGWGPGWRGWIAIPVAVVALLNALPLLALGALLYFLTQIETNLRLARRHWEEAGQTRTIALSPAETAAVVAAAPVEAVAESRPPTAGHDLRAQAAAEAPPPVEFIPPTPPEPPSEAASIAPAVTAPIHATPPYLPQIEIMDAEVEELPVVPIEPGPAAGPLPGSEAAAAIAAAMIDLERPAATEPLAPPPAVEPPVLAASGPTGKLPGAEEAARIANEIATMQARLKSNVTSSQAADLDRPLSDKAAG